jgi:hypothetical protein
MAWRDLHGRLSLIVGLIANCSIQPLALGLERSVDLPSAPRSIAATPDGGAWVLGTTAESSSRTAIWRIEGDGAISRPSVPVVDPQLIAGAGEEVWIIGYGQAAVLDHSGGWTSITLGPPASPTAALALGHGQAVVARAVRDPSRVPALGGCEVIFLDRGRSEPSRVVRFAGFEVTLQGAVADGRGGFWALFQAGAFSDYGSATGGRRTQGYIHHGADGWAVWTPALAYRQTSRCLRARMCIDLR